MEDIERWETHAAEHHPDAEYEQFPNGINCLVSGCNWTTQKVAQPLTNL